MNQRPPLIIGVTIIVVLLAVLAGGQAVAAEWNAGPEQPIGFTHLTHAGTLEMECAFCHRNVEQGANASVPAVQQCMFCHAVVTGETPETREEIAKLREAFNTNDPIEWARVHRLPDHVRFIHSAHIRAGFSCATCHGDIATMEKVYQFRPLKMGDCVACHRANDAPTDCTTCHK